MDDCDDVVLEKDAFSSVYTMSTEIGRGHFAVVKKCFKCSNSEEYAAKIVRKRRKGVDCRKEIMHEAAMLKLTSSHPNFVYLHAVYESTHDIVLITEFVPGGELFQFIISEGRLEEAVTVKILIQVVDGLLFLHQQNIAHLDVKPQNILLSEPPPNCSVKLCDLGLSRRCNTGDVFEIIGTPDYVAPEILDYQRLDAACDMWSVGVLAYVMLSGFSPFTGDSNQETFLNISQVNLDFPEDIFSSISIAAIDFMKHLLIKDPRSRMTSFECLESAWLKSDTLKDAATSYENILLSPIVARKLSPETHNPIKKQRHNCDDKNDIFEDAIFFQKINAEYSNAEALSNIHGSKMDSKKSSNIFDEQTAEIKKVVVGNNDNSTCNQILALESAGILAKDLSNDQIFLKHDECNENSIQLHRSETCCDYLIQSNVITKVPTLKIDKQNTNQMISIYSNSENLLLDKNLNNHLIKECATPSNCFIHKDQTEKSPTTLRKFKKLEVWEPSGIPV